MSVRSKLVDSQALLAERFGTLRDGRSGPTFFIEHGLSETAAQDLRDGVRQYARHCSLLDVSWRLTPLPLVVTATEIGYAYRGTGTDFWPNLESALETKISLEGRHRIRDLFASSSLKFRGAKPPRTAWTDAFSLIAWPITHALVPLEFHRQLSATLANLQVDIQELDDASLQQAMWQAARTPSVRFESFLQDHGYAVAVIRGLLGSTSGEISQDTISRIDLDLKADRNARLDIAVARRHQQRLRASPPIKGKSQHRELRVGSLQLRLCDGDRLVIEVAFPTIQGAKVQQLRRSLRRRRHMFTLWGVTSRIPSEQLLSGLPFAVKLHSSPETDAPLLSGLDELGLEPSLMSVLGSLQLCFQPPLLFFANSEGDLAQLVRGNEISVSRVYWLLKEEERGDPFANMPILGEVGPLTCFKLDTSVSGVAESLRRLGYKLRQSLPFTILGAPPLDHRDSVPRYLVGDERIIVPGSNDSIGMQVSIGSESIALDKSLVRVRVTEGEHVLEISSQGSRKQDRFYGVRLAPNEVRPICSVELCSDERSVQALLGDAVAMRVDGFAPLENLTLTIGLDVGGRRFGTSVRLGPLPQFLPAGEEPWQTLLDEATREHIVRESKPVLLHARVGTLVEESWLLERRLRPCWWTRGETGLVLDSDHGPINHGVVSVNSPAAKPASKSSVDTTMGTLLAPMEPNERDFGPAAGFVTYVSVPTKANLAELRIKKPTLRRALRESGGSLGIEDLAEAWLRWSLADCETLAAEIRRQQVSTQLDRWIAELTCGEIWAKREEAISTLPIDPWTLLARNWFKSGTGLSQPIQFTEREKHETAVLAVAEIQRTHPDLWERIDNLAVEANKTTRSNFDDDDYASFDKARRMAYVHLAEEYRRVGRAKPANLLESSGSGVTPNEWDNLLENVVATSDLRVLGELLLPTDTARSLMSLNIASMSLEEITEEFHLWARESRRALAGALPEHVMLQSILAFWISPETAVSLNWRSAMGTMIIERPIARAARYLAVRARAVRQQGESR